MASFQARDFVLYQEQMINKERRVTANHIQQRKDVDSQETWDLSDLFKDFKTWQTAFASLPSTEELDAELNHKYRGQLAKSPQTLFSCLQFKDELSRKLENLYVYANLRSAENVADTEANETCGKIENKMAALLSLFAFLEPEILAIPKLSEWIASEPLKDRAHRLNELIRHKPHVLSEKEEAILAKLQVPLGVFDDIHSKWNNVDLKFNPASDSQGKEHVVSNSRYSLNLQSYDRTLRKNTFNSYYSEISKWRHTICANYYGNMIGGSTLAHVKNFSSFLECELFHDDIPVSLYDNLIANVRKNLPLLKRSMELRNKVLKTDHVFPYDRYVSLYKSETELKFSWEEGRDLVLEAIAPLGPEYVDIARKGLTTERWIDRAENEGKRSGAFSWGTYDSRPYMLQTWTGTLGDVYTLAHELGHSMHSYFSHKNQPYHTANYTIFVAEVASTLNEALLTEHILQNKPQSDVAKSVISESLENFEGTVLRQVLFATFEREASKIADRGEVFTPDALEALYLDLNCEWYGKNAITTPNYVKHEWMRIPHFYNAFYVYKYATSYCASLALAKHLKDDPATGRKLIFSLLKAGGSKPSLQILREANVDFSTNTPVDDAFLSYHRNIERAEKAFGVARS